MAGGPFTYDGSQHGATVAATGVGGAPVGGSATTTYAGLPPLAYGPSPTEPSETCYRATATFADGSTLSAFFKLRK